MTKKISESFKEELLSTTLDLTIDYSEIFIDDLLDEGILKEVPFIKTLVSGAKIFSSLRDKFTLKKYLVFLESFHKGDISEEKYLKFKRRINTDKEYHDKIIENTMLVIERIDHINKSIIIANLFVKYVNKEIDWEYFQTLSNCVEKMNIKCISILENYSKKKWSNLESDREKIDFGNQSLLTSCGIGLRHGVHFHVNDFGKDIYELGIKKRLK